MKQRNGTAPQARSSDSCRFGLPIRFGGFALALALSLLLASKWGTPASGLGSVRLQASWFNFAPPSWVRSNTVSCQVQVTDPVGFYDIAEYRYTTAGDINAAPWITANLQVGGDPATTKTIVVTGLSLPDSFDQNLVQFRCQNLNNNFELSPVYPLLVDATPPENPTVVTSTSHLIGGWTHDSTIEMQWSGASDATSGIWGYSYVWDTAPSTLPDEIPEATGTQAMSPPLADGNSHYFHIRTRDNAGNWTGSAVHRGPYYVDTTPPENPVSLISLSHTVGLWSNDNTIEVTWSAGADNLSGVGGYSLAWDSAPDTLPDTITETVFLGSVSPAMPDSDSIWFHLRTVDKAGNWASSAMHLGPFLIDTTPPAHPTSFQTSHLPNKWSNDPTVTISWSGASDSGSGVAGYSYAWDTQPDTMPPAAVQTTSTSVSSPELPDGGRYYFHLRTGDRLGNWSDALHQGPFLIDTQPPGSPSVLTTDPPGWTNTNSFTVRWERNPVDPSGIGKAYCKLDTPPISNTDFDALAKGDDLHAIAGISVGGDGVHTVYVWLEDKAGNSDYRTASSPLVDRFHLDTKAPISDYALDRTPDCGGWYTGSVTVSLSSLDPLPPGASAVSGVAVISYSLNGSSLTPLQGGSFVVSGEGEHVVRFFAADHAGNVEITRTIAPPIKIDLHPPASRVSDVTGLPGSRGWWKSPVQVLLTATDQTSGVAEIRYRYLKADAPWSGWAAGAAFTLSEEGRYRVQHYAVDNACHQEPVRDMEGTINIDLSPPTTTATLAGTLGQSGWYVASPVTVTLWPTDTVSGVRETKYRVDGELTWRTWSGIPFPIFGEQKHTIEYYSADDAGNVEQPHIVQVGIDTTAPAVAGLPQGSPKGWSNRNDFTVFWTNPADASGVVGVYYKLNDEPQSNSDYHGSCLDTKVITHCAGIAVPREGRHGIYVWLRDKAGNADYRTRQYRPNIFSYDATAPATEVQVSGTAQGIWYSSVVTLTFQATDPTPPGVNSVSGVKAISYSIGCGSVWQQGNRVVISQEGRTTVCYRAEDNAGNVERIQAVLLRIDLTPPLPPQNVVINPQGWSSSNAFTISWMNPSDESGIAGAYYAFSRPTSPTSGILLPGSSSCFDGCSAVITVPSEGRRDLYLWLKDGAGNNGWQTPYHAPNALQYDSTAPTSRHTLAGTMGNEGWHTSAVTVTLAATDTASGVAQIRYRLRTPPDQLWQPWRTYAVPFILTYQGSTTIRYHAIDQAGNQETYHEFEAKIDTDPSLARVNTLLAEIPAPGPNPFVAFPVCWSGSDGMLGSGTAAFEIQSKDGIAREWEPWLAVMSAGCQDFVALPGHVYYFRARAADIAGNRGFFSGSSLSGNTRTYVQSVINGDFSTPAFAGWEAGGILWARQVITTSCTGTAEGVTLLGQPELGRGHNNVPIGYGAITQTIRIPSLEDYSSPTLNFCYRVLSYDVVWGENQKLFDSFDVHILDTAGRELALVLRDGNWGPPPSEVTDTGWKQASYSLAPYAGQTIQIRFACHNREDKYFNTWAYVDRIRVSGRFTHQLHLPAVLRNR